MAAKQHSPCSICGLCTNTTALDHLGIVQAMAAKQAASTAMQAKDFATAVEQVPQIAAPPPPPPPHTPTHPHTQRPPWFAPPRLRVASLALS